jgi:hypothetical protein
MAGAPKKKHRVLLWFRVIVMTRFLFRVLCFLIPPPLPASLFTLALPRRLVAVADALLGMVDIDLLLLLPSPCSACKEVESCSSCAIYSAWLYARTGCLPRRGEASRGPLSLHLSFSKNALGALPPFGVVAFLNIPSCLSLPWSYPHPSGIASTDLPTC